MPCRWPNLEAESGWKGGLGSGKTVGGSNLDKWLRTGICRKARFKTKQAILHEWRNTHLDPFCISSTSSTWHKILSEEKVSYLFKISKSTLSRIFFLFSIFTLKPNFIISLKETWIGEKKSSGLTFYFPLRWYNFGSKGFPREDLKTKHKGFLFFQLLIKISVGVFHLLMFIKTPFFLLFPLSSFWAKETLVQNPIPGIVCNFF